MTSLCYYYFILVSTKIISFKFPTKEGDLVTWDLTTNETDILVPHELLTSFSSRAQFKGFSPDQVGSDWRTLVT